MKISIIVPVYNSETYIYRLIESVLKQSYKDYELILVDDGSIDNSYEIMSNYSSDKIKVYKRQNYGPGNARKYGFEKSSGNLIFFVDSDDWITSTDSLEKINNIFCKNNIDILFFDREDICGRKRTVIKSFYKIKSGIFLLNDINERIIPGLGAKIFKRNILNSDMFLNSNIFEDLYTTYLYLDKCTNLFYENECYYTIYHDMYSNTLSSSIDNTKFYNSVKIILDIYNSIENEKLKKSLAYRMTNLFISYHRKYKKNGINDDYPEFRSLIKKMILILNSYNNVNYSCTKYKFFKNCYYKIVLFYYERSHIK